MFFDTEYVTFDKAENTVTLVDKDVCLPITVLDLEHRRVKRVTEDLQSDIKKVTGQKPEILTQLPDAPSIIVGTAGNKELMKQLDLNTDNLTGKWESFIIETVTLPDHTSPSLIIIGSDDRGAIFGVYDLTEKIGISPWYWWMDVPVRNHDALYVKTGRVQKGEPSVQYRGFFLNDEGPSLMTWVRTHFPDFTHEFYEKIFELTLRLKANYHWPAMWDSTFYEDDEQNIKTADSYGVVIGTSHHEPMDRPHGDWKTHKKGLWDYAENEEYLKAFWKEGIERSKPYETIINLGMRGDGDEPMGGKLSFDEKIKLMEKIITDQRTIIEESRQAVSVEDVPQMWALYKEVKEYYDSGMEVPEDVTLLWGDDNFGNIRRLPTEEERSRKGGAGIYYHFDYVGGPRSYKWVNTVPIQKTYEQMHKAYVHDAKKVWIVNVGDLKPMEFQTEFFLRLAWDVDAFKPDNLVQYSIEWAGYTFGEDFKIEVAEIIDSYVKFNGRLKPEVLNTGNIYSWDNEFEAERVLNDFEETVNKAERVMTSLPYELKDAFYQVAYYPAKASYTALRLQLVADLSLKHRNKGRTAANMAAMEAEKLFELDKQLTFEYNKVVSNGKWDHMMDQIHIGYTYWQQPDGLIMSEVGVVLEDELREYQFDCEWADSDTTDTYTKKPLFVDLYNKGSERLNLKVVCSNDFVMLEKQEIELSVQTRLKVSVDWEKAPAGLNKVKVEFIETNKGCIQKLDLTVDNPSEKLTGAFIPIDGKIAIEAEDYTDKRNWENHMWTSIPEYGRTYSSLALYPVEFKRLPAVEEAPRLTYDFVLPEKTDITITVITAPSLPYNPNGGMRLGISMDNDEVEVIEPGDLSQNGKKDSPVWEKSVITNSHRFVYEQKQVSEGKHRLHLTAIDPQVVIQKIIIDCGGLKETYLGPVATPHADRLNEHVNYQPEKLTDFSYLPGQLTTDWAYCMKSGYYDISPSRKEAESVNENQSAGKTDEIYLNKGWQSLSALKQTGNQRIELVKEWPLSIHPTVRLEDGEWVVHLIIHNQDSSAMEFSLEAIREGSQESGYFYKSKGWLKSDEQRLLRFICRADENQLNDTIVLKIVSEGRERELSIPLR